MRFLDRARRRPAPSRYGLPAALFVMLAGEGCSLLLPAYRSPLLDTPLGPCLARLWDTHGGLETWRRFSAVRFRYAAEGPGSPKRFEVPSVLIRFDEPGTVRVSTHPGADPGDPSLWRAVSFAGRAAPLFPDRAAPTASGAPDPQPAEDFALRSIAALFHLPFFLEDGSWMLRSAVGGNVAAGACEFETAPRAAGYLLGPFLVPAPVGDGGREEPGGPGGLERIYYASRHAAVPRGVYEARFLDYRTIDGILVAHAREHLLVRAEPGGAVGVGLPPEDPFRPALHGEPRTVLREWIHEVVFIESGDVAALDPLDADPADEDALPVGPSAPAGRKD